MEDSLGPIAITDFASPSNRRFKMSLTRELIESIEQALQQGGPVDTLELVAAQLLEQQKFHELFEVRKMQARSRLDLPLVPFPDDEEPAQERRDALDDALLDVCREIGTLFLRSGRIQEGWMYFRPVGATDEVRGLLAQIEVTDDNSDQLVGVLLSEGVDPVRGFEIVLSAALFFVGILKSFARKLLSEPDNIVHIIFV